MKFTPHGIKNQQFSKAVRGYDKEEVEAFLERLADEFEELLLENEKVAKEHNELKQQIQEYQKIEKNLQNTLLNATESSTKAVDSAKRQTQLMIKEAELKARQIVDKANEHAESVRQSVVKLREEKNLILSRLKAMVDSQASLLAFNVENIESKPIIAAKKTNKEVKSEINVNDILEKLL